MLSQTLRRLITLARYLTDDTEGQQLDIEGKDEYSRLAHSLTILANQIESQMGHLAESRDRFEAVLDAMREAVIALDASRRISFANVSACRLLGWGYPPLGRSLEECIQEDALMLFLRDGVAEDDPGLSLNLRSADRPRAAHISVDRGGLYSYLAISLRFDVSRRCVETSSRTCLMSSGHPPR